MHNSGRILEGNTWHASAGATTGCDRGSCRCVSRHSYTGTVVSGALLDVNALLPGGARLLGHGDAQPAIGVHLGLRAQHMQLLPAESRAIHRPGPGAHYGPPMQLHAKADSVRPSTNTSWQWSPRSCESFSTVSMNASICRRRGVACRDGGEVGGVGQADAAVGVDLGALNPAAAVQLRRGPLCKFWDMHAGMTAGESCMRTGGSAPGPPPSGARPPQRC